MARPASQDVWHVPELHTSSESHSMPQPPQLSIDDWTFTQLPSQSSSSPQSIAHSESKHAAEPPLAVGHSCPQLPQ